MFPSPIVIDVATSVSLPYGCILPDDGGTFGSPDGLCGPVITFPSTGEVGLAAVILVLAMIGAVALLRVTWNAVTSRFRRRNQETTDPEFIGFSN